MFCDELKLTLKAGKGGNGVATFRREKFVPRGGPDGGDGGNGGDVIFKVNPHLNTLGHLANKKIYKAQNGVNGQRKKMHGKNAAPLVLEVPEGTIIYNEDKSQILADLTGKNKTHTMVKGGRGGKGNCHFVSSTNQAPRLAEFGEPGEEKDITLELKLVADIGLVGLPSAGKSTLISVISNAKPKIAAYHFTTLVPNLGVVNMSKFGGSKEQGFVVADIPGLIEGASQGKGLGLQFLRHISRTKVLVHVIDGTLGNIAEDYTTINKELQEFNPKLGKTPQLIAINKIDMLSEEELKEKTAEIQKVAPKGAVIYQISALSQKGLKELLFPLYEKLEEVRKQQLEQAQTLDEIEETKIPVLTPHLREEKWKLDKIISKEDHKIFRITGPRIEQLVIMTPTSTQEGKERIYHYINRLGIQQAIERKGATYGDKIRIKDLVLPYRK